MGELLKHINYQIGIAVMRVDHLSRDESGASNPDAYDAKLKDAREALEGLRNMRTEAERLLPLIGWTGGTP